MILTTGFRIYNASALSTTNVEDVTSDGYAFQIEMVNIYFWKIEKLIKEVPIIFEENKVRQIKNE